MNTVAGVIGVAGLIATPLILALLYIILSGDGL
jgi:hypothetical protein